MATGRGIVRLQKMDIGANANKYYLLEDQGDGTFVATYGRVGEGKQTKVYPIGQWDAVINKRKRHGYSFVPLDTGVAVHVGLAAPIRSFVEAIFQEANEAISSYSAAPVDQISLGGIQSARQLLAGYRNTGNTRLIEDFYNLIPTKLPRKLDKAELFGRFDVVEMENRLDQMEAAIASIQGNPDTTLGLIGCHLSVSPHREGVIHHVAQTLQPEYRIKEVYDVEIPSEREAYDQCPIGGPAILFHGTRTGNARHIMRSGLRIRGEVNGSRFGRGVYFADKAARSMNYTGSTYVKTRVLFVCAVRLGKPKVLDSINQSLRSAPKGYDSVHGTLARSGMDEFIVYQPEQVTIRAVVELEKWR